MATDGIQTLEKALGVMGYLADQAEEREYLKRIKLPVRCTAVSDSVPREYRSGPKTGQIRGHQTNLVAESGALLPDIIIDQPISKGEETDVEVEFLIPDRFLSGRVLVISDPRKAKPFPIDPPAGQRQGAPRPPETTTVVPAQNGQNQEKK